MSISSIKLDENNLSRTGTLNVSTQAAPYNKLYLDLGNASLAGRKIALQKCNMYYSWPNVNSTNNTFTISWPTSTASYTDVSVTIPPGTNYPSVSALNDYLQTVLIANGMYVINSTTGDYLYYMSFQSNSTSYGVSLIQSLVPTSTPAGYTTPSGFAGWPVTTPRTMKLTTNTSGFNLLIGFAASTTFNGNTSANTFNSTFCPQLSPVSAVTVRCNLISNELALNNDPNIMYTFTTKGTSYGSIIDIEPINLVFFDIVNNSNVLEVSFVDQDGNPLQVQDPQISVLLLVT